VNRLKGIHQD